MANNDIILDSFTWSFSRINAYQTCPKMFWLQYVKCVDTKGNFFAEFGSFAHELLEKYFKGEIEFFELSDEYTKGYRKSITSQAPPNPFVNLNQKYYEAGLQYFNEFEGMYSDRKVLGVEQEISIKIGEYNFTGFIDLIAEDENGIIIVDHKSKKMFKTKKERLEYLRQLYIYSIYIYDKYGKFPYLLVFNMFRENKIVEELFDQSTFEESIQWALDTISSIYNDQEFKCNPSDFFCNHICSCAAHCSCSNNFINH